MKKFLTIWFVLLCVLSVFAQEKTQESIIRELEETERQAILNQDLTTLQKIWANNFMVNSPLDKVFIGGQIDRIKSGLLKYSSFTREIEHILAKDDIVITMGNESVTVANDNQEEGQTIKRRFTNIWLKQNGSWILSARHANNICQ